MAKKFLDVLGDAFEDDMLEDVIPTNQRKRTKKRETPRRNKSLLDAVDKGLTSEGGKPVRKTKGKSLLDSMDEALDNHVFDVIFPDAQTRKDSKGESQKQLETRFSTMITTEVFEKAREIALAKGIRIKDVINKALEFYLDSYDK
ncbi:MAG: hypothetical protein AAFR59_12305 [Bacteroidota bacterium]